MARFLDNNLMIRSSVPLAGASGRERYGYLEQNFDRSLLQLFAEVQFWERLRFEIPCAKAYNHDLITTSTASIITTSLQCLQPHHYVNHFITVSTTALLCSNLLTRRYIALDITHIQEATVPTLPYL